MKISADMDLNLLAKHMGEDATVADARVMRALLVNRYAFRWDTANITDDIWDALCDKARWVERDAIEQPQDDHDDYNPHTDTWRTVKV